MSAVRISSDQVFHDSIMSNGHAYYALIHRPELKVAKYQIVRCACLDHRITKTCNSASDLFELMRLYEKNCINDPHLRANGFRVRTIQEIFEPSISSAPIGIMKAGEFFYKSIYLDVETQAVYSLRQNTEGCYVVALAPLFDLMRKRVFFSDSRLKEAEAFYLRYCALMETYHYVVKLTNTDSLFELILELEVIHAELEVMLETGKMAGTLSNWEYRYRHKTHVAMLEKVIGQYGSSLEEAFDHVGAGARF